MALISKTERILNLIAFLLKSRWPVPWSQIREEVEGYNDPSEPDSAIERRFERDKATLRSLGIPVIYRAADAYGAEGYSIETGAYFLPHVEFTPEEITILAMAARAAPASGPLRTALQSALLKLQFDSPIPGEVRSTIEERYLFYHPSAEEESSEGPKLEALTGAVLDNKTVVFDYDPSASAQGRPVRRLADRTGDSPTAEGKCRREVDPFGLAFWAGHWYLVGFCRQRGAIRTFRTDRMEPEIKLLNPGPHADFKPPKDFDVEQHVGTPAWRLHGAGQLRVRVKFDATVAWMVREQAQKSDRWRVHADGSATLERAVSDPEAFIRWVLGFGKRAEILAPLEVRLRFVETVRKIRALYPEAVGAEAPRGQRHE